MEGLGKEVSQPQGRVDAMLAQKLVTVCKCRKIRSFRPRAERPRYFDG
jgi:hypothetical protein